MESKPWDPVKGETVKPYTAFVLYRDLGPGRTLEDAIRHYDERFDCKSDPQGFRRWSKKFSWDERCLRWEHELVQRRANTELRQADRTAMKYQAERERRIQENLFVASLLREKAMECLKHPVTRVVEEKQIKLKDGTTQWVETVIEPSKWGLRDIAVLLKIALDIEKVDLLNPEKSAQFDTSKQTQEEANDLLSQFRAEQLERAAHFSLDAPPPIGTMANPIDVEGDE